MTVPGQIIYPQVISASRATDIPACHAEWFMERLRIGQCHWQNPFNARQRQTVSFAETKAIVFWSKNPAPLAPFLSEIADYGKKFYFQFTLNDYEEGIEPGIPELEFRLRTFAELAVKYKVIWRYDPVIVGDRLTIKRHIQIIANLMKRLGGMTDKLVFSFVDIYGRVKSCLKSHNSELRAPAPDEALKFATELAELRAKVAPALKLATCAEAGIDFSALGIEKNACIDAILINEICGEEIYRPIQKSATQASLFPQSANAASIATEFAKDKGQRKSCGCAPGKDIGSYRGHPCKHGCIYCYAGHARRHAESG